MSKGRPQVVSKGPPTGAASLNIARQVSIVPLHHSPVPLLASPNDARIPVRLLWLLETDWWEMARETVLIVDDDARNVEFLRDSLLVPSGYTTLCATDGEQALHLALAGEPDLILLDLNLPKKDGREVLAEIKNDVDLKRIPVVILSTSKSEEDIMTSYALHANCYIAKPINLDNFLNVVKAIEDFWLTIVKLPPNGATK